VRKLAWNISKAIFLLVCLMVGTARAQDAKTVIRNAEKAMGDIKSVRYSGSGHLGVVGMNWNPTSPWHATLLTSYTRAIDYATGSSREDIVRNQENPPALGGEAPYVDAITEGREVSGKYAWNQPINAYPPPPADQVQPALAAASERELQIWLTPHGFLKAAAANNATAKEVMEGGKKFAVLTFMAGKFKLVGTIDSQNLVTKIDAWTPNPVLGDMPVEVTFTGYKDFPGMKFPTHILQMEEASRTFELDVAKADANVPDAAMKAPDVVLNAKPRGEQVKVEQMGDGVWMLYGSHNSVLIEFKDYLAVVEAPVDEARSIAVLAEVKKLVPNKPIKYVINTHHHFDHSGGLRTFVAEGATVITHEGNKEFYEWAWKQPHTIEPDRLSENPREPTFITFKNKYVLSDGTRDVEVHWDFGDMHDQFLSFVYMPKERILIEADDFSAWYITNLSLAMWNNLYGNLARLQIDPLVMAPLHGEVTTMAHWVQVLRESLAR